jgi:protocatechuate 3,4-dioxygenase beta subunit
VKRLAVAGALMLLVALAWFALWRSRSVERPAPTKVASNGLIRRIARGTVGSPDFEPGWFGDGGRRRGRIAGRVVTPDGQGIGGARVHLGNMLVRAGTARPSEKVSDAEGRFAFEGLAIELHQLSATAKGYAAAAVDQDLRDVSTPHDAIEIVLYPCTSWYFGTVTDASGGAPVAGARLSQPGLYEDVETDGKGAYELCIWPHIAYGLRVDATGYASVVDEAVTTEGRNRRDFNLVPEGTLDGRVVQLESGDPVPYALVELDSRFSTQRGSPTAFAVCDGEGRFHFAGLGPGRYSARALDAGARTFDPVVVAVEAAKVAPPLTLRVESASRLRGVVVADGKPVGGVRLGGAIVGTRRTADSAISNARGEFVIERAPRGVLKLTAWQHRVVTPLTVKVDRAELADLRVEIASQSRISGMVKRHGKPCAGTRVAPGEGRLGTFTDRQGKFELRGLAAGTYKLSAESGPDGAAGESAGITLGEGEQREGVEIDLVDAGSAAGEVVDQGGAPLPNLEITVGDARHGNSALSDAQGRFIVGALPAGRFEVRVSELHGVEDLPWASAPPPPVQIADRDAHVTGLHLAVKYERVALAGRVVDPEGRPVADARVVARPGSAPQHSLLDDFYGRASATSGVDGRWRIGELRSGAYRLVATGSDGGEASADADAGREDVRIVLDHGGTIRGHLVGFHGVPEVSAQREVARVARGVAGGDGFVFERLAPGTYTVTASSPGEQGSGRVEVIAGKTVELELRSAGSATLRGRVVDLDGGAPAAEQSCGLSPLVGDGGYAPHLPYQAWSDERGELDFGIIPAGDVIVSCHREGYAYASVIVHAAAGAEARVEVKTVHDVPFEEIGFDLIARPGVEPRVRSVDPDGAPGKAGLRDGDLITSVGEVSVVGADGMVVRDFIASRRGAVALTTQRGSITWKR